MGTHPIFESDFDCLTETPKEPEKMEVEKSEEAKATEKRQLIVEDIKVQFKELEKVSKIIRQLPKTRRQLDGEVFGELLSSVKFERRDKLLKLVSPNASPKDDAKSVVDEVELYSCLLVLIYLLDQKRYDEVRDLADSLVIRIGSASGQRRSLDPLNAKVYYYHSRVYELTDCLADVRPVYMKRLRSSALHGETESESVLLNLLLRNFLHHNLFEQAEKLIS